MAGKNNKPAEAYAKPHTMDGKPVAITEAVKGEAYKIPKTLRGVYVDEREDKPKETVQRGKGAATKGFTSRGPMG